MQHEPIDRAVPVAAGATRRLVGRLWARANARLRIVASEDESAYYAWVDEYLDRLVGESREIGRVPPRPGTASTIDEGTAF
jgi:hypothetical protein